VVELNGVRIWAVAEREWPALPARKLVCGTLARPVAEDQWAIGPRALELPERLAVPGRPDLSVGWTGWFELTTGEVVGVYGAMVEPVG